MPDFLQNTFAQQSSNAPLEIGARLLAALVLGWVVAWIYRRSVVAEDAGASFPMTLVLLSVLIAMVTQVIGDNIARAFSLVGALSIVRFRTVVRDTRDTAFVIFAVVIGMSVGAAHLWVALIGIAVIGIAAPLLATRAAAADERECTLRLRLPLGVDPETRLGVQLARHLSRHHLLSVATDRTGATLEYLYEGTLLARTDMAALLRELSLVEGVHDLRCEVRVVEGAR